MVASKKQGTSKEPRNKHPQISIQHHLQPSIHPSIHRHIAGSHPAVTTTTTYCHTIPVAFTSSERKKKESSTMVMRRYLVPATLLASLQCVTLGFQLASNNNNNNNNNVPRRITINTRLSALSIDENSPRQYDNFAGWSNHYGLQMENGFQLAENEGDWSVVAGSPAARGSRMLFVPGMLKLSSKQAREEEFPGLESVEQYLDKKGSKELIPQFYLFLKVLREYQMGEESPYAPWLDAMPKKFSTAVTFDDFEVQCLPPFVGSLSRLDRINFGTFTEALERVSPDYISQQTKTDSVAILWAFNVVFTRCWSKSPDDVQIVPMADMFNHASSANVEVKYDGDGNCQVILTQDVQPGEPLCLSYGNPTNPSRFLSTFGFLDESPPATFCKIMTARPSKELKNLGYDFSRMVFYVENGAIAEEVWDVVLYSLLENRPEERQRFYHAHMTMDRDTKVTMHSQYLQETINALLVHVDKTLSELDALSANMQQEGPEGHDNLMMIWRHNEFVRDTFVKVKSRLDRMLTNEKARREETYV